MARAPGRAFGEAVRPCTSLVPWSFNLQQQLITNPDMDEYMGIYHVGPCKEWVAVVYIGQAGSRFSQGNAGKLVAIMRVREQPNGLPNKEPTRGWCWARRGPDLKRRCAGEFLQARAQRW